MVTTIYIPLERKRKTQPVEKLKRVRNIQHNPNVALLIDEYDDDWSKLVFVMIQGKACLIGKEEEKGNENNNNRNNNSVLKEIQSALSKVSSIQGGWDWGILHKDTTTKNNHLEE